MKDSFQFLRHGGGGEYTREERPLLPHLLLHLQQHLAFLTLLLLIVKKKGLGLPTALKAHLQKYKASEQEDTVYEDEVKE